MKKQLFKGILVLLFGVSTTQLFSQTQNKTANATINFNGLHCNNIPPLGPCGITVTNKINSNTVISYNKVQNELTFTFSTTTLDTETKNKLLNSKLEKNFYLYTFDEDFILSEELKIKLNIQKFSKIKKGNYLIKIIGNQIIMKLKLG